MIGVSPPNPKIIGLVQNMKIYTIFRGERPFTEKLGLKPPPFRGTFDFVYIV